MNRLLSNTISRLTIHFYSILFNSYSPHTSVLAIKLRQKIANAAKSKTIVKGMKKSIILFNQGKIKKVDEWRIA